MIHLHWADHLPAAVTVCDREGIILYMNAASSNVFASSGVSDLVGKSLFDCHSPQSVKLIQDLMTNNLNHIYTIQKKGKKKMIYQSPYLVDGIVAGMVEITFELPAEIPHFNRD
jgi:transcriptional regulator with PAS, ATPase and Fis domain